MPPRVRHFSEAGNLYTYFREHESMPKTLCNREMTNRYRFTAVPEQVTCDKCKAKLIKLRRMAGQVNGEVLTVLKPSDVDCGDAHHEAWLQRLGIN